MSEQKNPTLCFYPSKVCIRLCAFTRGLIVHGVLRANIKTRLRLLLFSFSLDLRLLVCHFPLTFIDRSRFIFYKYLLIIKHNVLRVPLNPEVNKVSIGNSDYFYGSVFGMVVFQSMIITLDKYMMPLLQGIRKPVIIDVGAHLGFFSIPLAATLKQPRIYALEPVSVTFSLLKKNTYASAPIKAVQFGLWDKAGKKTIYYNPRLLMYSSLFQERFTWDKNAYNETVTLETLDAFCKKNQIGKINLLKIDAEGAEERILKGGTETLSHTQYLFLECSLDQADKSTFTSLMSRLNGQKFNFQLIKLTSRIEHKGHILLMNILFKNILFTGLSS